jgi:hypothetical protein
MECGGVSAEASFPPRPRQSSDRADPKSLLSTPAAREFRSQSTWRHSPKMIHIDGCFRGNAE